MSLSHKRFAIGDKVIHMAYGKGTITEDISNQFAEVYNVKYKNGLVISSSVGLLAADNETYTKTKEIHMDKVKLPKRVAVNLEFVRQQVRNKHYLFNRVFEEVSEKTISHFDHLSIDQQQLIDTRINELYKYMVDNPKAYYSALVNGYEIEVNPQDELAEIFKKYEENGLKQSHPIAQERHHLVCQGIKIAVDTLGLKIQGINE